MKHFAKILALGAALVVAAPLAHATSIDANFSVTGVATYTYTSPSSASFSFVPPDIFATTGGTTISPYFTAGQAVTFASGTFALGPVGTTFNLGSAGSEIATSTEAGETLTFYITDYTTLAITPVGALVTGDGYFTETGTFNYTSTPGQFSFSPTKTGTASSFSANTNTVPAAVTPEPSSLMLLGTGLVSAAGMLVRRRRIA